MNQADLHSYIAAELDRPRHADPLRLTRFGRKAYSQGDEDGIIAEIFRRIGTTNRAFVEFGVETGTQNNTAWLLLQGWSGLWIEASETHCTAIRAAQASRIAAGALALTHARVTAETINALLAGVTPDLDLLSIDIDNNDYWVWEAIEVITPRVVCIEYNAAWLPPASLVVPYEPDRSWGGTNHFGASLEALCRLGDRKGYSLVGCSLSGVNAFFVRKDLCQDRFLAPGSSAAHFEPARYFLTELTSGHHPALGEVLSP